MRSYSTSSLRRASADAIIPCGLKVAAEDREQVNHQRRGFETPAQPSASSNGRSGNSFSEEWAREWRRRAIYVWLAQASCAETASALVVSRTRTSGLLQHVGFCEIVGFQGKRTTRDLHLELVGLRGAVGNRLGIARLMLFAWWLATMMTVITSSLTQCNSLENARHLKGQ